MKHFFRNIIVPSLLAILISGSLTQMSTAQATEDAPTSLTETYGQWVVRCVTPASVEGSAPGVQVCEMFQELRQSDTNQRVLVMSLLRGGKESASLTLIAPFGLLLSEGIKVGVDETDLLKAGFRTCLPAGCVAVTDLSRANVDALTAGETATVTMVDTNNQTLGLNVSLTGFSAAWNRLGKLQEE